ncbi:hypothetical protein MSG28_008985 [Choristoneura fumiferana]|uniref:Uncharacterized protein n=1 Tax=Choristoneura fumiferana TaxID=7141 RepID=A0ACC0J8V3_CHOFU|nr:hypothetical protein MSG28_008985 [Choristoneura fumiferana]
METPKDTVSNLIAKIAEEIKYVDYDADIKEISSHGANLTAVLFLVKLKAKDKKDINLFAKVAVLGDSVRKTSPIPCPFTTEIYFYKKVLKQFEMLQEKHSVPEEHRLVFPKIYGINEQYLTETIVLENLMANGFKTHARQKTVDLEYASTAIELIAKFHALSLAYCKEDPEDYEEVSNKLTIDTSIMLSLMDIMKPKMIGTAMSVVSDVNKEKLEKYLAGEGEEDRFLQFMSVYYSKGSQMLAHGDFKPSNLMHRRQNEKLEMVPVDFQMVHTSSPTADLMYFFFTGADEDFRRQHYHKLLDQYYEQLKLALERLDVDPEEAKMVGLMMGVILLPIITVAEENLPTFDDGAEVTNFVVPGSELRTNETILLIEEALPEYLTDRQRQVREDRRWRCLLGARQLLCEPETAPGDELAVKFREIENRHEIEDRDRVLLPKFYGGSTTFREETIVLEDITSRGFIAHDPRLPFGWEYASKVVEQLAKFHALSFVYSLENPAEFTKILEDNPYHIFDTKIMRDVLFDMTVPVALKALEGENRERLKNYLDSKDRFEEMLQLYRQAPKRVIVHGDFKTSNLMHRRQIIHAGTPVTDLLYFIFLGSDEEFRRLHYHDLLEHYYLNLKKSLGLMKVEVDGVYPKTAYEADLKMALPIGLAVALTILPMIQVDSTDAMKIEEDVSPSQTHKPNSLYPARINGVINDYVKWGIL